MQNLLNYILSISNDQLHVVYLIVIVISFLLNLVTRYIILKLISHFFKKTSTDLDDILIDKGVLEFVEAASRFDKTNCSFLLAGDIDIDNPNSLRESKLNEIKKFQYIEYLGKISHSDMAELFNKASVFVLPSYREGLPQAALEAGACSMPLILTDVNGCRDCLIDNETGFLIREKNVDSLVNKINLFVCNPDLVVQMGNRSKEYIRDNFSEEKVHNQFHEIY